MMGDHWGEVLLMYYMANEFNGYGNVKLAWGQCKDTGTGPTNTVCHTTQADRLAAQYGWPAAACR